jgi:hypothetical protein
MGTYSLVVIHRLADRLRAASHFDVGRLYGESASSAIPEPIWLSAETEAVLHSRRTLRTRFWSASAPWRNRGW